MIDRRRADLLRRLEVTQKDLADAEEQIEKWKTTRQLHTDELKELKKELSTLDTEDKPRVVSSTAISESINYMEQEFEWSKQLKLKLKRIFGIDDFRLCQKGCVTRVRLTRLVRFTFLLAVFVMQTSTKGISSALCQQEEGRV